MKKQAVCEYCGQVFDSKDYEYDNEHISECAKHEMSHLNLIDSFRINVKESLSILYSKYDSKSQFNKIETSVCYDDYYGKDITYSFEFNSDKIKKSYKVSFKVDYDTNKEHIPTNEEIMNEIEKYYISNIKKEYKGKVSFEDFCGGHGEDDYILDNRYIRDIFKELTGKNIEIKILD